MEWPVLLMARALEAGGSERQLREIAKSLDRSRFQPHVGCFLPDQASRRELEDAGVPIAHFPIDSFLSPKALAGAFQLARYIRRHRIRLIHTFDYPSAVFAVPAARFLTAIAVASSQRSHRDLIPPSYRKLVRLTDHMVNAIVVNCDFVRRHLERDEQVPPRQIQLCYNGIDLATFRPLDSPRPPELPPDAFVIGVVCALRPEKGLSTLLEAFARIRHLRPPMKLAIVGDGPVLEALKKDAETLGIQQDCVFALATNQVADWLRAFDIFVLPSLSEALSNALMEAMACGCPAVASNVGGNPELVWDGERGLLFEPGDAVALGAALQSLIEDDARRKRLGQAGASFIRERFSIQASAHRMGEIYEQLIRST
ncbi:MAG TPA: glycosyltransferase [Bryobacteraceae bacterium]|nr:glycosyltransferase [Bryobacteraceae bacterium]